MVKTTIICIAFLLLLVPLASAIDTTVKIKTLPFHEVQATPLEANAASFIELDKFRGEADQYGDIEFTFSTTDSTFDMTVFIKWQDKTVISKRFTDGFPVGQELYLEIAPAGAKLLETPETEEIAEENLVQEEELAAEAAAAVALAEEEEAETTEEEEVVEEAEAGITGLAISSDILGKAKPFVFYVLGAAVLVGVLVFVFRIRKRTKLKADLTSGSANPAIIVDLQNKIREAQKELNMIKNQDKIKEAENKIQKDREELEKLRRGD